MADVCTDAVTSYRVIRDEGLKVAPPRTFMSAMWKKCKVGWEKHACPNILVTERGVPQFIDCKYYGPTTYITTKNVEKIINDKEIAGVRKGYIITTEGKISDEKKQKLEDNGCSFISLGKPLLV